LAKAAHERLGQAGWVSLFVYLRRKGFEVQAARDMAHELLAREFASGILDAVKRGKGRLRVLLRKAADGFLVSEKLFPGNRNPEYADLLSKDAAEAEARYQLPPSNLTPDQAYDQLWSLTLHQRAVANTEAAYNLSHGRHWFDALKDHISGNEAVRNSAGLEARLNTTTSPIRGYIGRLRHHFGNELIREIMETVGQPEDMVEERRVILGALSGAGPRFVPQQNELLSHCGREQESNMRRVRR